MKAAFIGDLELWNRYFNELRFINGAVVAKSQNRGDTRFDVFSDL